MQVAHFEGLCAGLCELTGTSLPDMTPDDGGIQAIAIELHHVCILISTNTRIDPGHATLLTEFGCIPYDVEVPASRALLLLNTQIQLSGNTFCRNPLTGEVVLRRTLDLTSLTAPELYKELLALVEGVQGWRTHHFLSNNKETNT